MVPREPPKPRKRQQLPRGRGAELREEILVAAEALVDERGGYDLGMREVAARTGVTTPAVYKHFENRNDLLYAVAARKLAGVARAMDQATIGVDNPAERIRLRGLAYLDYALNNRANYRLLYMGNPEEMPDWFSPERLISDTGLSSMITDAQAAIAAGQFSAEYPPAVLACLLWMSLHGVASLLIALPTFPYPPLPYLVDQMMKLLAEGFTQR
jgi:AcrR family transcriptional regulator